MDDVCQYSKLYRLLRDDEDPKKEGITAEMPNAEVSVHDHVSFGSRQCSQFISTSATWDAIMTFADYKVSYPKRIARINIEKLEEIGGVSYIDLTDEDKRDKFLEDSRADKFARKFKEVLIIGTIPASCIDKIYLIPESESEIDSDSEAESDFEDEYFDGYDEFLY